MATDLSADPGTPPFTRVPAGRDFPTQQLTMRLLVMLVGLTFGALLVPMIITQDQTTRFDISRARTPRATP